MHKHHTFFTAKAETGIGNYCFASAYDKIGFTVDANSVSTLTVKFQGSIMEDAPDFTASQTSINQWDYIEVVDMEDGTAYNGDVGCAIAGAVEHLQFQANVDGLIWVNVVISDYTSGDVTARGVLFNLNK